MKSKKAQRSILLFTLLLVVAMLAGCAGAATPAAAPAAPAADSAAAPAVEAPAAEAPAAEAAPAVADTCAEEIVLNHWYHQYGEAGTFEAAERYAAEYTAATPCVTVKVNWVPGDYFASLNSALLTADGPDVFELQTVTQDRVSAGQLASLDDIFEGVLAEFDATAMQRVVIDGAIYGVPMIIDPQFVYYNKSMLADAGVEPPTTMDELIAATVALDTGRVKGLYLSNDLGATSYLMYMATWAANSDFIDGDKVVFNTPDNLRMWQKKLELVQTGSMLVGATTEWWDPGAFIDGLTAMQWTGLWALPGVIEGLGVENVGVIPWPALDDTATPSVFLGGWNQSVNANSANVDASKAYVKWLWIDNAEAQIDWNLSYGFHIPPRSTTAAQADALKSGPAAEVLAMLPLYGKTTPNTWTGAMDSIYSDAHAQVLLNGADPAEQLQLAADAAQKELDTLLGK
ncbi:MAG: extracellular solute-binding protein [Caldilineaceae bacterium]|nr:extracellular solute-binding protein [Caldilineaceae bacterium]MBP8108478.1 extracellular solute-binding protein [Caldilineaceae bacterium]MBP8123703.1 extracellular solute-binding protein [Caldilineaceae bacterium]MBP9073821.1 extracellular solute-binding protein [Caldilineaceae bacterium]